MMRLPLLLLCVCSCGAWELDAESADSPYGPPRPGPLHLFPQDRGDESPACLDGSPYGVYFARSPTNSTKWTIDIQGGGWCYDEELCAERSQTDLGSSRRWPKKGACGQCWNVKEDGTFDVHCNCVHLPYGDGASFSGFRAKPWPVPGRNSSLYFRGIKNFDAAIDFAFAHGMDKATEVVIMGGSAGGLSTFLHADRLAARIATEAPDCTHYRALPIAGYFLDHDNFVRDEHNYTAFMKYIYHMQNLTSGADGGLMASCTAANPDNPHYCFMSPHMQKYIQTPFFMFNSKFDEWQLVNELQTAWETQKETDAVLQYGKDFLKQFEPMQSEPRNGAFVTSCVCHGCPWNTLVVDGKTAYQQFADWYYGKSRGADAIHIDPRGPNGDGRLTYHSCKKFPQASVEKEWTFVV